MAKFSLYGILLAVGVFFALSIFILSLVEIENPYTGIQTSAFGLIIDWILP